MFIGVVIVKLFWLPIPVVPAWSIPTLHHGKTKENGSKKLEEVLFGLEHGESMVNWVWHDRLVICLNETWLFQIQTSSLDPSLLKTILWFSLQMAFSMFWNTKKWFIWDCGGPHQQILRNNFWPVTHNYLVQELHRLDHHDHQGRHEPIYQVQPHQEEIETFHPI